ncbi:MAG: aryl-sulfate sulfotransferase, partial [Chloroflexota bacterium]
LTTLLILCALLVPAAPARAVGETIGSVTPGAQPFISFVAIDGVAVTRLKSVKFTIAPKSGATARAISGTYSKAYLQSRGYISGSSITVPVYGLYPDRTNQVQLEVSAQRRVTLSTAITTTAFTGADERFTPGNYEVLTPRNPNVRLDYSYIMLKTSMSGNSPLILDVDGEVRWAGTAGLCSQGAILFENGIYADDGCGWASGSTVYRMEMDGTYQSVVNLSGVGVWGLHHNYDPGKRGILVEVNRNDSSGNPNEESFIYELSGSGAILDSWDISAIFRAHIRSAGENPDPWIRDGRDWFHNNSVTFWKQQNQIVVSSRENFVVGIGYTDKKIKWILGDSSKAWHDFASLRSVALTLTGSSIAPMGEHGLSITPRGELMLFDNGEQSYNQDPLRAGDDRGYSAPRRYKLDLRRMRATETWNWDRGQSINSPICSSIYQDGNSYLVDYASESWGSTRLVGLDRNDQIAFEYRYPGVCDTGWNAIPVHIEALSFK